MEDDQTVKEMRRVRNKNIVKRSFMAPGELVNLRVHVLKVIQSRLCEQLINPSTGNPLTIAALSRWENGKVPVPLWAARLIRDLSEAARKYDSKKKEQYRTQEGTEEA